MNISIWRYSHLTLAISSFIFILIAAITGVILAVEPIANQLKPYAIDTKSVSIAQTLTALEQEYDEVITLNVNQHHFVTASVITKTGNSETFYINPKTGKKISHIISKPAIYKFATTLHRSLFLKSTGRILVGFFSFLLLLITVSGVVLIVKRQGGIGKFFTKIIYEDFEQFYHVTLSRFLFIPIVIITITGVFLSLDKFSVFPKTKIKHNYNFTTNNSKIPFTAFTIFKNTNLSELKNLEFPFSDDEEDYFVLKLTNNELLVHQYTGEIISNQQLPLLTKLTNLSLLLHTGSGTILWASILLISCIAILFFVYSGFAITLKRRQNTIRFKNSFTKDEADYIILIGSETGNTFRTANAFFEGLIHQNKKAFITTLNNYTYYQKAKQLIIFTATYGEGEAPINATHFLNKIQENPPINTLKYSIVGFGSLAYPQYCKYAIDVDTALNKHYGFTRILPLTKINNQNFSDFKKWVIQWNQQTENKVSVKQQVEKQKNTIDFTVVNKTDLNSDDTFLITLKPNAKTRFQSGDLLAITPETDNIKRLYSIAKVNNNILLSIKKHELGICSNLIFNAEHNTILNAGIEKNKSFHFPKKAKEVILIGNGTGVAPYLGMLNSEVKTNLFCGLRTKKSLEVYKPYLPKENIYFAFSQEGNKFYVQDILLQHQQVLVKTLKNNGVIMICGSVAMMNAVLSIIANICKKEGLHNIETYQKNNQIKTDCY